MNNFGSLSDDEIFLEAKKIAIKFFNLDEDDHEKFDKLKVEKQNVGLSNFLFLIEFGDEKYFLKIFGILKEFDFVNRELETILVELMSKNQICPKIVLTDQKTFRIEELFENFQHFDLENIFEGKYINKLFEILIELHKQFESFSEINYEKAKKLKNEHTVYYQIEIILNLAKKVINEIKEKKFDPALLNDYSEKIEKISNFLENFEEIRKKLNKFDFPLIISHNDVHVGNLLIKNPDPSSNSHSNSISNVNNNEQLCLIDYEYASFNFFGFDIINYCIESFFDLNYTEFPFYKTRNVEKLFESEKYFEFYLKFIETYFKEFPNETFKTFVSTKEYFDSIAAYASIYWALVALIFIDFEAILNKTGFDYVSYALDRLRVMKFVLEKEKQ